MRSRRAFTAGFGACVAGGGALLQALAGCGAAHRPAPVTPAPPELTTGAGSLKAHAAARHFLSGCAVNERLLKEDAGYSRLVCEQANIVTPENAMKWDRLRPTPETFRFEDADAVVKFAESNRMKVRGHNLCWHRQLPVWFAAQATAVNARQMLIAHIQQVAGRYAGRMHSWDVVNEAVQVQDGRADGLRDSPWLRLVGADYIEAAFQAARDADPQALLTYNEYGIEGEDPASAKKRAALLILLRRMKARRVPLDALGIQSHLTAAHAYGTGLSELIEAARGLGLQVFLTEMDVNDRECPSAVEFRDKAVADTYRSYLDVAIRDPAVRVVMTWGITDRNSWLNSEGAREDGLPQRCLPFDRNDAPTKAFFAMRNSFDRRAGA